jgi:hypothetical protein
MREMHPSCGIKNLKTQNSAQAPVRFEKYRPMQTILAVFFAIGN